jgi:hypothetical protein
MRNALVKSMLSIMAALALALPLAGCIVGVAPEPVVVAPAPVVIFPYVWVGPGYYGGTYYHNHPDPGYGHPGHGPRGQR